MLRDQPVDLRLSYERADQLRHLLKRSGEQAAALLEELEAAMAQVRAAEARRQRDDPLLGLHLSARAGSSRPVALSGDIRLALGYESHAFGLEADVAKAARAAGLDCEIDCDYATFYAALRSEADALALIEVLRTMVPAER